MALSNIFFATVFALESIMKICAHGVMTYFRSGWNVFDFVRRTRGW